MADVRRRRWLGWCAAGAIGATTLVLGGGPGSPASAQTVDDIAAFLAAPGVVRAEIPARLVDTDQSTGLVFVVGESEVTGFDLSDPFEPRRVVNADGSRFGLGEIDVVDMDVAGDGSGLVVASGNAVFPWYRDDREPAIFDADDAHFFDIDSDERKVVAAPDGSNRFITWTNAADLMVVDGTSRTLLNEGSELLFPPVIFGATSDTVVGIGPSGFQAADLREVAWQTSPPTVVTAASAPFRLLGSIARHANQLWLDDRIYDARTLGFVREVDLGARRAEVFDEGGDAEFAVLRLNGQWALVDPDKPSDPITSEWYFSTDRGPEHVTSLGDGLLAVVERTSGDGSGFLTVVDAELLGSNFGEYAPIAPTRVLDTRTGEGAPRRAIGPAASIDLDVVSRLPVNPADVLGVVLNVTVPKPTANTYVTVWPAGTDRPVVSSLNVSAGRTLANMVTVPVGRDGDISIYNNAGSSHVVVDLVGFYTGADGPSGARYVPAEPTRLVDTRLREGQRFEPGEELIVGIPGFGRGAETVAAVVNVTGVGSSAPGFLTTWAFGERRPLASTLNVAAGEVRANLAVVPINSNQAFLVFNGAGTMDVVVDLVGIYREYSADVLGQGGRYLPTRPFRAFDSRESSVISGSGRMRPGDGLILPNWTDYTDIINVAAVQPDRAGFMSVVGWSDDSPPRDLTTSTVNFAAGQTTANAAYATGAPDHAVVSPVAGAHLVVDVFGFLTPERLRPIGEVWGTPT